MLEGHLLGKMVKMLSISSCYLIVKYAKSTYPRAPPCSKCHSHMNHQLTPDEMFDPISKLIIFHFDSQCHHLQALIFLHRCGYKIRPPVTDPARAHHAIICTLGPNPQRSDMW